MFTLFHARPARTERRIWGALAIAMAFTLGAGACGSDDEPAAESESESEALDEAACQDVIDTDANDGKVSSKQLEQCNDDFPDLLVAVPETTETTAPAPAPAATAPPRPGGTTPTTRSTTSSSSTSSSTTSTTFEFDEQPSENPFEPSGIPDEVG